LQLTSFAFVVCDPAHSSSLWINPVDILGKRLCESSKSSLW
jgi:hypothetical protein